MQSLDESNEYDGLIVFTDGMAHVPPKPKNKKIKILWLFLSEYTYEQCAKPLSHLGKSAFLRRPEE
jgi:predicted metal-dependent peptidase